MNKEINIKNYQAYWIDYLDGKLTGYQEEELFEFLENNSEISSTLIDADSYTIPDIKMEYPNKEDLFSYNQIDNLIIAKIEHSISDEDGRLIDRKITENKDIKKDYELYKKTILIPNTDIVFPNKNKLKKNNKFIIRKYSRYAVAASIVLTLITGFILMSIDKNTTIETSQPAFAEIIQDSTVVEKIVGKESEVLASNEKPPEILNSFKVEKSNAYDNQNNIIIHNVIIDEAEALKKIPLTAIEPISTEDTEASILMGYRVDFDYSKSNYYTVTVEYKKEDLVEEFEEEIFYKKNPIDAVKNKIQKIRNKYSLQETIYKIKETREDLLTTNYKN